MEKFTFEFMVQRKSTGITKEIIIKKRDCLNSALFIDGLTYTSAMGELEQDNDVITYMEVRYKVGKGEWKQVNSENDFKAV